MLFLSYDFSGVVDMVIPKGFTLALLAYPPLVPVKGLLIVSHNDVPLAGDLIKTVRLLTDKEEHPFFLVVAVWLQKEIKIPSDLGIIIL